MCFEKRKIIFKNYTLKIDIKVFQKGKIGAMTNEDFRYLILMQVKEEILLGLS